MELKSLIGALSLAGMVLQGVLVAVLLGRKTWKRYPLFTIYGIFSFAMAVMLNILELRAALFQHVYFYSYYIQEAIAMILGFCVVYEIFRHLFSTHRALLKLA